MQPYQALPSARRGPVLAVLVSSRKDKRRAGLVAGRGDPHTRVAALVRTQLRQHLRYCVIRDFQGARTGAEGAHALASALAEQGSSCLMALWLTGKRIGNQGWRALSAQLVRIPVLRCLCLAGNHLHQAAAPAIVRLLEHEIVWHVGLASNATGSGPSRLRWHSRGCSPKMSSGRLNHACSICATTACGVGSYRVEVSSGTLRGNQSAARPVGYPSG